MLQTFLHSSDNNGLQSTHHFSPSPPPLPLLLVPVLRELTHLGPRFPDTFCNSTPYPYFCRTNLPYNKPSTIHDYTRLSVHQALSHSREFLSLIDHVLNLPSTVFPSSIHALQDCQFLINLNIDSLSQVLETINFRDSLDNLKSIDLQTLLSATLTNLDTCLDGIKTSSQASTLLNTLFSPLFTGTRHCSVSLAFFTQGFCPASKRGRGLTERKHIFSDMRHGLSLKMSDRNRKIFESAGKNRKLLQTTMGDAGGGGVVVSHVVVVNRNGMGNFTTINDAVAAAPDNSSSNSSSAVYFVIYVVKGHYQEYVSIPTEKQNIMMIGDGIGKTIITGNRSVVDGWSTFNCSTFAVFGQGFVAVNITFRNTAGPVKHQAVAVQNSADMSTFYSCGFEGYQDTLYTHSFRQFYRDCEIYGTVDYIFGNAAVVFQNCKIHSRLPLPNQFNAITAQGRTDPNQNTGTSIQNCSIKSAKDLASSNGTTKTYLGRPWREYSRTVVMQSDISSLVDPTGWTPWNESFVATLYYAEFNNTGAGSNTSGRVTWPGFHVINATEACNFTVANFIQGDFWLPATGMPFTAGMM